MRIAKTEMDTNEHGSVVLDKSKTEQKGSIHAGSRSGSGYTPPHTTAVKTQLQMLPGY